MLAYNILHLALICIWTYIIFVSSACIFVFTGFVIGRVPSHMHELPKRVKACN